MKGLVYWTISIFLVVLGAGMAVSGYYIHADSMPGDVQYVASTVAMNVGSAMVGVGGTMIALMLFPRYKQTLRDVEFLGGW